MEMREGRKESGGSDAAFILCPQFWGPWRQEQTQLALAASSSSLLPGFCQPC